MSERPNFAEVLVEHGPALLIGRSECICGAVIHDEGQFRSHLAAVLNTEVDRWLADEGTRERVADAFGEWLHRMHGVVSSCDHTAEATGILAALATPTVPTAEEGER